MLRRLSVRGKVLAVLAVPILVLVVAATFISAQALNEVRVARAVNGALGSLQTMRVFAQSIQAERAAAVNHVAEVQLAAEVQRGDIELTDEQKAAQGPRAEERAEAYASAVTSTDATMSRASERMDDVDFEALDPLVYEATQRVVAATEGIQVARDAVERGNVAPNVIAAQYSAVINEALMLTDRFAATIDNRQLGVYLSAYSLVDLTVEAITNERDFGHYAIELDGRSESANAHLRALFPGTNSIHARARAAVDALARNDLTMPDLGVSFDGFANWQSQRTNIVTSDLGFESVRENLWFDKATAEAEALEPTLTDLWRVAQSESQSAQSAALGQSTVTIVLAVLALALSILVALLISRTIVVPLTRLTTAAGEVRDQLPRLVEQVATPGEGPELALMQIPVNSSDEVGRLAEAFNEVNQKTVEVAQEQAALRGSIAEMFVNVARRDQVLLNRQLSFIDTLEREEEDPNTLANLFRLDHLATRMRRNAESLLVLAGIDSGRRVRGSMSLSDVIRTASSEIEQYDRVGLELGVDPEMHGFNSLPAAHLLAELLENATVFSEPGTPVEVVTSAEIEFITVTIVDRGLGMSADDIAAANARIRQTTASEVVGAQRLGLHVVGRLANRLGTKVVFAKADDEGGTQVRVRFPRALFVDDAREAQPGSGGRLLSADEIAQQQAPVAVPVDLEALTDGETGLGLPRRRAVDAPGPGATPAQAPAASAPAADAPTTSSGLPARRNIVLPERVTPNLAPEVAASAAAGWSPAVAAPAASGLPSRAVGATAAAAASDDGPAAPPRPAAATLDPGQRSGMFAGFRRGAEAVQAAGETERDDARAEDGQLQQEPAPVEPAPMVVPGLVPDEEYPPAVEMPQAPAVEDVPALEVPAAWQQPAPESPAPWQQSAPETPAPWQQSAPEAPAPWQQSAPEAPAPWQQPAAEAPAAPAAPAVPSWGTSDSAWSPAAPEAAVEQPYSAPSPYAEPEAPTATHYPAFSPDAGYAAPEAPTSWSAEPQPMPVHEPEPAAPAAPVVPAAAQWSPTDASSSSPVAPVSPESPAAPSWLSAASPAQTAPPVAQAPVAPVPVAAPPALPAFADVVGQAAEPVSRRSRRADSSKPSRAERRAARKAEAKERADEKARAKAEARAAKKGKGAAPASVTGPTDGQVPAAPAPGFLGQPASIAALRAGTGPATAPSAPAPLSAAWSAPADPEPAPAPAAAPAAPQPTSWSAPAAPAQPQPVQPQPVQPAPAQSFTPAFQPRTPAAPANPAPPAAGTAFTPAPASAWSPGGGAADGSPRQFGVLDDEVAAMLALRSDIQEQALSELSQLSAYRPQVVKPAASLSKRTPSAIPSAPEMAESASGKPHERDPEQLRSRLSSFQSGASRGRRAQGAPTDSAPSSDGAVPMANGSAEHANPGAGSSEPAQEAQTW